MKPHRKILLAIFSFFFIGSLSKAQEVSTDKQLLGTVIFKDDIFNYTFRYYNSSIYDFQLERVTKSKAAPAALSKTFFDKFISDLKNVKNISHDDSVKLASLIKKTQDLFSDADKKQTDAVNGLGTLISQLNASTDRDANTDAAKKKNDAIAALVKGINTFSATLKGSSSTGINHPFNELKDDVIKKFLLEDFQTWNIYKAADDEAINTLGTQIFNEVSIRMKFKNDEPATAYLKLKSDMVPIYQFKSAHDSLIVEMKVANIQVEFDEGAIKNIYAELFMPNSDNINSKFEFRNNKPITISGKYDADSFDSQRIFSYRLNNLQKQFLKIPDSNNDVIYFRLSDVIKYLLILENYKEDYSPADSKVDLSPANPLIKLKKQLRSKILTVKAYSDFNGLNSEAPNGLVQLEGSIGTNIITKRFQGFIFKQPHDWYTGTLTRIDLTGTLSKLEEHNKYMVLNDSYLDADSLARGIKTFKINALNLFKYQSNSINVNLNIYKLNIPQAKLNFQLNGSLGVLRTGITDSVTIVKVAPATTYSTGTAASRNSRSVTSMNYSFTAQLEFSPENRYGFSIGYRLYYLSPLSPEIVPLVGKEKRINTLMLNGFICTTDNSKLFFRWQLNKLASNSRLNYNQVQIGYLVDIFKVNKD